MRSVGWPAGPIGSLPRWKTTCAVALLLAVAVAAAWLFLPSAASAGFSPWDRLSGETPGAKVAAFAHDVGRGDEATDLRLWELPSANPSDERFAALAERRAEVTRDLIAAGVRPDITIRSIEWWRTCCEPGVTEDPANAGGARMRVEFVDRDGAAREYVVDVFNRDGAYWGAAAGYPPRHWVIRDVYPDGQPPLFWTWGQGDSRGG